MTVPQDMFLHWNGITSKYEFSNDMEDLNLWHFEIIGAKLNFISLSRWDLICIYKIIARISVISGININTEVMSNSKYWTKGRVVQNTFRTNILLYSHLCCSNFILWTLQGEQESLIRIIIPSIEFPWFISKSTNYEAITTQNHFNDCTLVVTLGIKVWYLPYIPWYPVHNIQISTYSILYQPLLNLRTPMFGEKFWNEGYSFSKELAIHNFLEALLLGFLDI